MSVRLAFAFLLAAAFFAAAIACAEPRALPSVGSQSLPSEMPGNAPTGLSAEDLQELVAPIAIYPDPLLALMLESSLFPDDVAAAAAFVNSGGTAANAESKGWDEAVVALVAIPDALNMLHNYSEWAAALGTAFVTQSESLMEAVQEMRRRAWDNGSLHTTPQQVVVREEQTIIIRPANPSVIYVPVFNPYVVFAPVVVVRRPDPLAVAVIGFGVGVVVGGVIWSNSSCNWRVNGCWGSRCWNRGSVNNTNINVNVNNRNNNNNNNNININNPRPPTPGWTRPGGDREPWRPMPDRPNQGRDFVNRPGVGADRWRGVGDGSAASPPRIPGRDGATPITRPNIPAPGERRPAIPSTRPATPTPPAVGGNRPTRPAIPTPTPVGGNRPTLPRGSNLDRPGGSGGAFDLNRSFPSSGPRPGQAPSGIGGGNRNQPAMRPAPAPAGRPIGGGGLGGGGGGGRGGAAPLGGGRLGGR